MHWGKTDAEKEKSKQKRLESLHNTWQPAFAWHPVKLDDGTWIWFEWYEYKYLIYQHYGRFYISTDLIYKRKPEDE